MVRCIFWCSAVLPGVLLLSCTGWVATSSSLPVSRRCIIPGYQTTVYRFWYVFSWAPFTCANLRLVISLPSSLVMALGLSNMSVDLLPTSTKNVSLYLPNSLSSIYISS